MTMKQNNKLTEELLTFFNRYFFSIEKIGDDKEIHLLANVYYNDGNNKFRMDEWKFKYLNVVEVGRIFEEGNREKIDDFLSTCGEEVSYQTDGDLEELFSWCSSFFDGEPGKGVDVSEIGELPVGNYYFDWNHTDVNIFDKEFILENVYIGLQSITEGNFVKRNLPELDGIESYLYVRGDDEVNGCRCSMKLTKAFLEMMELKEAEVWKRAEANTNSETVLKSIEDLLYELSGIRPPYMIPMYVVTNHIKYKGASAILNKKILKEFGGKFHTDKVIVLPSSIHECILLPGTMIGDE